MGLFYLCMSDDKTEKLKACVRNIELYLENPDCDYLLQQFALPYLKDAVDGTLSAEDVQKILESMDKDL